MIGETIADKSSGNALPTIKVEELTVKMSFSINISSFVGQEVVQATMNKDVGYDFAVDIWSMGFTIIVLFTGKHPWSGLEPPPEWIEVNIDAALLQSNEAGIVRVFRDQKG
ncbi:putative elongation factor TypA-like SVR3, chloroplastic [Dendrobium catenatum]|uniref:putative elongation factor TypA-like SVR3, chloroplastic n=1 Tax=Dendrobium catenatum TaxID=906689 RepID=UPI0009F62501|nr:putative elongation factor TypA-like SVR3, chloroplastic [Dendrobium catenatum]